MYLRKYIPACETFGWVGGPEFMTRIVEMRNGRERRNAEWANARHRFQLPYWNLKSSDYARIKSHHLVCRGRLHNFLYQDRLDHSAQAAVFGIAEAGQTAFQLGKTSELDGVSYFREVNCLYRPDPASPGDALEVIASGGSQPGDGMLHWAQELELGAWFSLDYQGSVSQVQYVWRSQRGQLHLFLDRAPEPGQHAAQRGDRIVAERLEHARSVAGRARARAWTRADVVVMRHMEDNQGKGQTAPAAAGSSL